MPPQVEDLNLRTSETNYMELWICSCVATFLLKSCELEVMGFWKNYAEVRIYPCRTTFLQTNTDVKLRTADKNCDFCGYAVAYQYVPVFQKYQIDRCENAFLKSQSCDCRHKKKYARAQLCTPLKTAASSHWSFY